jgi:lipopolysaccharide transport system ATP-binding protein
VQVLPAIKVDGVWKEYVVGASRKRADTFYESLSNALSSPFKRLRGEAEAEDESRFWALKDVSFEVQPGEVVGVIGRNGAGKSTLLKILSRITAPTKGRIEVRGRLASLLEVGTGFHPELTGRENVFLNGAILGMTRRDIQKKFDEIVAFAEVEKFIDTPVKRYSSGMAIRLAFSVAAHLESEVLLVDEVLAVGDIAFQRKCIGKMGEVAHHGRTVLFVSHNLDSIQQLCSTGVLLDRGRITESGAVRLVLDMYMRSIPSEIGNSGSVIDLGRQESDFDVYQIEVLDAAGNRKDHVRTWDEIVFRIHFEAKRASSGLSVVFQIASPTGTVLHLCSTQPDRVVEVQAEVGRNSVDIHFPRLSLASGFFRVGAGLAIPNVQWLSKKLDVGMLEVKPMDVFESGLAPESSRYLVVVAHNWIVNTNSKS